MLRASVPSNLIMSTFSVIGVPLECLWGGKEIHSERVVQEGTHKSHIYKSGEQFVCRSNAHNVAIYTHTHTHTHTHSHTHTHTRTHTHTQTGTQKASGTLHVVQTPERSCRVECHSPAPTNSSGQSPWSTWRSLQL